MALLNKTPPVVERPSMKNALVYTPKIIKTTISKSDQMLEEALKGIVSRNEIKFPTDLGEEHPFNYTFLEKLIKRVGILSAITDKHIDYIMSGGINVISEDARAQQIIENFMQDVCLNDEIVRWLREAFNKGVGFMELGTEAGIDEVGVLESDTMYINRDEHGELISVNQYLKPLKGFNSKDIERFEPNEVAILNINLYGDDPYGQGLIYPLLKHINDWLGSNKEMHVLMKRKSNNPLIFTMGNRDKDQFPKKSEMEELGQKLETLDNKHEWVISDFVKASTVDFGNISEKFEFILENDMETLAMAAQIPMVILGKANVPEGLAREQSRSWELRIQSLREQIEKVVENDIFKRVLNSQGIDAHVEIVWGLPGKAEKREAAKVLIEALKNPFLSPVLRERLEGQLAETFDIPSEKLADEEAERKKKKRKNNYQSCQNKENTFILVLVIMKK